MSKISNFGFSHTWVSECFDSLRNAFDDCQKVIDDALSDVGMDEALDAAFGLGGDQGDATGGDERVEETITKPDGTVIRRVITRKAVRK